MVSHTHRGGNVRLGSGGYGHEIVIRLRRALGYRYPVNRIAEQPERYGNVTNRNGLRHPASQRHGRSAEASGKAATAGGNATRVRSGGTPSGPDIAIHSNGEWDAVGCAGSCHGEARPARERGLQLQRWLRNQASDTARTLGLDAANRRGITQFSQQRAKTHSPTGTTCNARKPKCSWAGTDNDPGGTAPACWLGENFGSPQKIDTGSALKSRLNGFFRPRAAPRIEAGFAGVDTRRTLVPRARGGAHHVETSVSVGTCRDLGQRARY